MTSNPLWSRVSKRLSFASVVLPKRRVREFIQATGSDILLEFGIPTIAVELLEPRPELRQIVGRKGLDRLLDLFHGAHTLSVSAINRRSPTDLAQLRR